MATTSSGRAPSPAICTAGSPGVRWMSEKTSVRIPKAMGIICRKRRMMYCVIARLVRAANDSPGRGAQRRATYRGCRARCRAPLRKVPTCDLHGRQVRSAEVVVPGSDARPIAGEALHARERLDDRLRPTEVRQPGHDVAVADQKRTVARGAGHQR